MFSSDQFIKPSHLLRLLYFYRQYCNGQRFSHFRRGDETFHDNVTDTSRQHARTGFLTGGNIQTHPTKRQVPKQYGDYVKKNLMYTF